MADTLIPVVAAYTGVEVTALREMTTSETIPSINLPVVPLSKGGGGVANIMAAHNIAIQFNYGGF